MTDNFDDSPVWQPSAARAQATRLGAFMEQTGHRTYADLWRWSIDRPGEFWPKVIESCGAVGDFHGPVLEEGGHMIDARWFPQARLNYAENLLRFRGADDALVFWGEDRVRRRMSREDLYASVSRCTGVLREAGVGRGDRVGACLPNLPEALIAMLATASLGAIWSSVSPDFGAQGVLDRLGQLEPKILICVDGYWYGGKHIDCLTKNAEVASRLPSLTKTVVVPYIADRPGISAIPNATLWPIELAAHPADEIVFDKVDFRHPLWILFSSGTTGVPKCIVHGHGGALLQHLKEHQLHSDVRPGDRLFYFTTCSWMMWNWLVSGLASGAALLLYDGSPFAADGHVLFDYAQAERATHFGTSAKFIDAAAKMNLHPGKTHDLGALRVVLSTGSPLAPDGFDWVYREIKANVQLASISGGTDIVSCFVLGNPLLPVYRGEIQSRGLGMAVDVFNDDGSSIRERKGELVCTRPFPVMPVGFWNDPDDRKYRAAYFERFPNVWCHGDFSEITCREGVIIHGRSDATLNPGGVRIGTAEIYRVVEQMAEIAEALVIGQAWPPGKLDDVRIVLFVRLRDGTGMSDELVASIRQAIRESATPRHVPAKILAVPDIPRTKSGKLVELAVRNVVHDLPVKNSEALANPDALKHFRDCPELQVD